MKILIFTSEFIPFPGGVASHTVCLAFGLNKLGHKITLLTKKYRGYTLNIKDIDADLNRQGIRCIRLLYIKKIFIFIWRWYLKKHLKRNVYDYIILNDNGAQLVMSEKKIFNYLNNYCLFVHGKGIGKYFQYKREIFRLLYDRTYLHNLFINAAPVIANSNSIKSWLLSIFPETRICVVHNCVNTQKFFYKNKFKQERLNILHHYNIAETDKILLTASRLVKYKGHDSLLEIFSLLTRNLKNVKLLIAGTGKYRKNLEKKIRELNLLNQVVFTGALNYEELRDLYQLADVFILLSRTETFGLVFLEANSCKTPVIGSDIDGIREAIQNNVSGFLVNPLDKYSVIKKIEALLNDSSLNRRISQSGYERAITCFNEETFAKKVIQLFIECGVYT